MSPYNLICLISVLDHHREGFEQAHPDYVIEKYQEFSNASPETAYAMLDWKNQARVDAWCELWGAANRGKRNLSTAQGKAI